MFHDNHTISNIWELGRGSMADWSVPVGWSKDDQHLGAVPWATEGFLLANLTSAYRGWVVDSRGWYLFEKVTDS